MKRLAAVVLLMLVALVACGGTTYSAHVAQVTITDPGTVNVGFEVTNTGSSAGSPSCVVKVTNASGSYHGQEVGEPGSIEPGDTFRGNVNVPVNGGGAESATDATVKCS